MLLFISLRNVIFIFGVILVIRLIGKFMTARRNVNAQKQQQNSERKRNFETEKSASELGKMSIQKIDKRSISDSDFTDFEEIKD